MTLSDTQNGERECVSAKEEDRFESVAWLTEVHTQINVSCIFYKQNYSNICFMKAMIISFMNTGD